MNEKGKVGLKVVMENELDLITKERQTVTKIEMTKDQFNALKKARPSITYRISKEVNRRNGGQHPLSPPKPSR